MGYKIKTNSLFCGIVGYSGSVPAKPEWIKMIMMYNEERGEDTTGWAVNNKITKNSDKVSKFITENSLTTTPQDENFTIVAHARKASSGARFSKELAHPFGVYENDTEKDKYDLILAMNGTLSNTELLAKKWKIDFTSVTNSDTQMLAKAMVKLGWDNYKEALELYDGTATLAFFNPNEPNTLMIFKDPDRPLYCWSPSDHEIYISSMQEPLYALGGPKKDVLYFRPNELYRIENGKIITNELITRTPARPVVIKFPTSKNNNYSTRGNYHSEYDYENTGYDNRSTLVVAPKKEKILLRKRCENSAFHNGMSNRVYPINERYFRNGHPLQGKYNITTSGKAKTDSEASKISDIKQYYFVNGYMCKSEKDYDILIGRSKNESGDFDLDKFLSIRLGEIVEHFEYPVIVIVDGEERWMLNTKYSVTIKKSGDNIIFSPFLSDEQFKMTYKDQWTKTTKKVICEITDVDKKTSSTSLEKSNDLEEDIMSMQSEIETIKFLAETMTTFQHDSPHFYHTRTRKDLWRLNPSQILKEYFFTLLLRLAKSYELITEKQFSSLKKKAEETLFSGKDYINEMENIVRLLKKKFRSELFNSTKVDSTLSTTEKIKAYEDNISNFTEEDIIKSIQICNSFYLNPNFKEDVYKAKDNIEELRMSWIGKDTVKENFDFNEAILLCLNVVEKVTDNELLYALETPCSDLTSRVNEAYVNWQDFNRDCKECKIVEEEPVKEAAIIEAELLEEKNPEYYEISYQSEIEEVNENLKEISIRMEKVDSNCKNDRFKEMERKVLEAIRYMRENIIVKK